MSENEAKQEINELPNTKVVKSRTIRLASNKLTYEYLLYIKMEKSELILAYP